ncbi:MAG: efflux RND transporter periplasmic adaptor subunit [Bacteroidales bacterium]|nr:efflux RND transporter periplasmic adaptor subunit [Bacteroidales bacterium]MBN2758064.1 efflux RND transporter periplasmic adaptor subunit [Bacteroidales bacterium]
MEFEFFKERRVVIVIAILSILLISFGGMKLLGNLKSEIKKPPIEKAKRYVLAKKVKYTVTSSNITASGRVESQDFFDISAEVQGKILNGNVNLKKGAAFKKGELLIQINNKEYVLSLNAHKSRFLNSVANLLPDFKIDYPNSYQNWQKFFSDIDINKNLPNLPEIKSEQEKIYLASRNILSDFYTIKAEEERLRKYSLTAPFSGSFSEVYLRVGSIANPGSKIATIISTDKLELEVPVNENEAKWVKKGDLVNISDGNNKEKWKGYVARKSNFVDPKTQTITVFVSINSNYTTELYKGVYLNAEFPGMSIAKTMEIPRNAVFNNNEVFFVQDSLLMKAEIKIHKINENTLIFSGLPEGTDLVVEPLINASENMKVSIIRSK